MLCDDNFDKTEVKDVIARVLELDDKDKALELIDPTYKTMDESSWNKRVCW